MSDLISRSRAIENIWDVFNSYANDSQRFDEYETEAINSAFKVLQKAIENQPTAYDLDKVVAELETTLRATRNSQTYECIKNNGHGTPIQAKYSGEIGALLKAIEIVKRGGVNDR